MTLSTFNMAVSNAERVRQYRARQRAKREKESDEAVAQHKASESTQRAMRRRKQAEEALVLRGRDIDEQHVLPPTGYRQTYDPEAWGALDHESKVAFFRCFLRRECDQKRKYGETVSEMYEDYEDGILDSNPHWGKAVPSCEQKSTRLHVASRRGNATDVVSLLQKGMAIDSQDANAMTPLHHAAVLGHVEVVHILLKKGAAVNTCDQAKMTPLHYACKNGFEQCILSLISAGAALDARSMQLAISSDSTYAVQALLDHGFALDCLSLLDASKGGCKNLVEFVLQHDARAAYGAMPCVCQHRNQEIVKLILQHMPTEPLCESTQLQLFHLACRHGNVDLFRLLCLQGLDITARDESGRNGLHHACHGKDRNQFSREEKLAAFPGLASAEPIPQARTKANHEFSKAVYDRELGPYHGLDRWFGPECGTCREEIVALLLAGCVDASAQVVSNYGPYGATPLHFVCNGQDSSSLKILQALLAAKSDVNAWDASAHTPLYYAVRSVKTDSVDIRIVEALLQSGANLLASLKHDDGSISESIAASLFCPKTTNQISAKLPFK